MEMQQKFKIQSELHGKLSILYYSGYRFTINNMRGSEITRVSQSYVMLTEEEPIVINLDNH